MSVEVTHEPDIFPASLQERCCVCRMPTPFWFTPKDVALCQECAKTSEASTVPTKAEWIAEEERLFPKPFWQQRW